MLRKKEKKANQLSDFWMVDKFDVSKYDSLVVDKSIKGYMKLAILQRSIADFVRIVTRQRIPVEFLSDKDISMTDGKKVYISAKIEDGDLDSIVGLALHEAAHVKLSDYKLLTILPNSIPNEIYKAGEKKGSTNKITEYLVKNILNWVEDRRIDRFLYTESPGYRGYYQALYNRYFHSDIVTKGLVSDELRTEDINSYMYRITNMINSKSDLNALKGLKEISDIISVKTIDRLRDTGQALNVTFEVMEIIYKYIEQIDTEKMEQQIDSEGDGDPKDGSDGSGKKRKFVYDPNAKPPKNSKSIPLETLTEEELKDLIDAIQKQKDFLGGAVQKVRLSGNDLQKIKHLSHSGTEIKKIKINPNDVENEVRDYDSVYNIKEYDVTVIKKVTLEMAKSGIFTFVNTHQFGYNNNTLIQTAVNDGIRLGKQLGRKLQIRNEERLTKYTRKETGKIDKRLLAELGFGNEGVFQQTFVEMYADAILHMSVDISGSMGGTKLANAIKVVVAVCQAASMTNGNLDVVVDVRSTEANGEPFVAIIYDSRVDNMMKVKQLFPYLQTSGTTPEGLCFAAIQELISDSTHQLHSYFLNLSDGEPYFEGYSGTLAAHHTRGEVHKMRQRGIIILSYFISDYDYHHDQFDLMYGKSAAYINTNSLMDIARTLNKMFLSKN